MSSSNSIMVHITPCFISYGPLFMKIHHLKQCQLSKSNTLDQNFIKLCHIVKYHDVFFKFDNGPYRIMPSVVMAPCLWKFTIWNDVRSLIWIFFIRILCNLVTLFSTMMLSSSSIMIHIAPCFQQLWPFVYEGHRFEWCPLSNLNSFDQNFMKLCHIVKYHDVFFKFDNALYGTML